MSEDERMGRLIDNFLLLFVGLKLAGLIDWSWWWVFSPLWGAFIAAVIAAVPGAWRKEKQRRQWQKMKAERVGSGRE